MSADRLANLCKITTRACTIIAPMVFQFYSSITGETAKLKSGNKYSLIHYIMILSIRYNDF